MPEPTQQQPIQEPKKTCTACFQPKPLTEFSKQSSNRDGLKNRCKICDKRYYDDYYAKNAPKIIESVQKWQGQNLSRVLSHKQTYREKTKPRE